jgi:hypothetical protein
MGSLLRELGFSKKTVRNKMKLKSITRSTLSKRAVNNVATKEKRLAKAKMMLNKLKAPAANGQDLFL